MNTSEEKEMDQGGFYPSSEIIPGEELWDRYVNWVLKKNNNNKYEAARQLQISVRTIYNQLNKSKKQLKNE